MGRLKRRARGSAVRGGLSARGVFAVALALATVSVASGIRPAVSAAASSSQVFVLTRSNIEAFDSSTGALNKLIAGSGVTSNAIAASPDGKSMYAVYAGNVTVIDTATDVNTTTLSTGAGNGAAQGVAVSPDGTTVYAVTSADDLVSWDAATGVRSSTVVQLTTVAGASVYGVAVTSAGTAFAAATIPTMGNPDEEVLMVPAGSPTVTHSEFIGQNTTGSKLIAVAGSDGARVFVTDGSGDVAVINASTGVGETGLITQNATGMATFGAFLYTAGASNVERFDYGVSDVSGPASGVAVALSPDGSTAFVPSLGDELQSVDAGSMATLNASLASLDDTPVGVAVGGPFHPSPGGVSIGAGDPVPEPATGSVPASFTVALPAVQASDVTVHYKTVDGTGPGAATAAANDYTAVADGQVTIPKGQTSEQIQVQVDSGSGQASTMTESFQVQLTSASGELQIGDGTATGVILIAGIAGKVTDASGIGQPARQLTLTGTAASGHLVTQHVVTDGGGRYQLYADPGIYTLTPDPLGGKQSYEAVGCPGTAQPGTCAQIALGSGANLTVDFKLLGLVVNSTGFEDDPAPSLAQDACDVTPEQAQQTCTLPAAIQVANRLGGGTIGFDVKPGAGNTFDGEVPQIDVPAGFQVDPVAAPVTIDGTTQPDAGKVEITGSATEGGDGLELARGSDGSIVRGLVLNRFLRPILVISAGRIVIQGNLIGTDPTGRVALPTARRALPAAGIELEDSANDQIGGPAAGNANLISGNADVGIDGERAGGTVVQGNTIGPALGERTLLEPSHPSDDAFNVQTNAIEFDPELPGVAGQGATADTVGGATAALGNVIAGQVSLNDANSVFQGNTVTDGWVASAGDHNSIGGSTPTPGKAPGNDLLRGSEVRIHGGQGTVVQGNHLHGGTVSPIWLQGGKQTTIGGAKADLGNTIEDATPPVGAPSDAAGIRIGMALDRGPSAENVIENNTITNNHGDGGVEVLAGTGNHITNNVMGNSAVEINLGGGPHRYNTLNFFESGPNHYQPYPDLLSASSKGSTVTVTGQLTTGLRHAQERYTIDFYAQPNVCDDSISEGQAGRWLGSARLADRRDRHRSLQAHRPAPAGPEHRGGIHRGPGVRAHRDRARRQHLRAQPMPDTRAQGTPVRPGRRDPDLDHAHGHDRHRPGGARRPSRDQTQHQAGQARALSRHVAPVLPADHDPLLRRNVRAATDRARHPRDRAQDVQARPRPSLGDQPQDPPQSDPQAQARPSTPDAPAGQRPRRRQTPAPQADDHQNHPRRDTRKSPKNASSGWENAGLASPQRTSSTGRHDSVVDRRAQHSCAALGKTAFGLARASGVMD